MQVYLPVLRTCPLFRGLQDSDILAMLACLSAGVHRYAKCTPIFLTGTHNFQMGIILDGQVDIVQEDFWGNQGILARLEPGELFAESFALAHAPALPVSVLAAREVSVLLLDYPGGAQSCPRPCAFRARLTANLLAIVAEKNIALTEKISHVTRRTTREKLLAYLSVQAQKAQSPSFSIPYDRQALADYLGVDRSAMSAALSRMRQDGLLLFTKNHFTLVKDPNNPDR